MTHSSPVSRLPLRRPLLIVVLFSLLAMPIAAPAQAEEDSLERGEWRRVLLSQNGRSASYRFTASEPSRIGFVSLNERIFIDIEPASGAPNGNCGIVADRRHFQNILCSSVDGTYIVTIRLRNDYSKDAVTVFLRFDFQRETSYPAVTTSVSPYPYRIEANSIHVLSFNDGGDDSRYCVSLGHPDVLRHAFSTRSGELVNYDRPGNPKPNENPSYRLRSGNAPHYLILFNPSGGGMDSTLNFRNRSGKDPC